jgi:hypothetical protein
VPGPASTGTLQPTTVTVNGKTLPGVDVTRGSILSQSGRGRIYFSNNPNAPYIRVMDEKPGYKYGYVEYLKFDGAGYQTVDPFNGAPIPWKEPLAHIRLPPP